MATEIKEGLYYSDEHEWVRVDGEKAYIGITDFAQHQLGDIVFVELPELDSEFEAGESIGVIESVKAVSDMHTPVSGTVTAVNEGLEDAPESLNSDPYGEHIAVIKMSNNAELEKLMNSKEYADFCEKEE
ncbi:MAG TPA: glycine cleavage system protein GcvH [Syntrophaceticus sp.]|jgi:glycine cleavage system H protein|nr:glycine cleavage system protein GcvH [Syntrophaceticus schinkii]MDD4675150.1 glycine cleavage system protein GcvH [Syntrophaceticus schinkii]HHY29323.1 glycine cleavage system protein GcvH [Syntrophaceticus sp.]